MMTTRLLVLGLGFGSGACTITVHSPARMMPAGYPERAGEYTEQAGGFIQARSKVRRTGEQRAISPSSLEELEMLTSRLKQSNGIGGSNGLELNAERSGTMARIYVTGDIGMIYIHPNRLRTVPLNSWAFILGHELAHQTLRSGGSYEEELNADVVGAKYAANTGYDPAAYLAWVMRTQGSGAKGRVQAIGNALRVPKQAVWAYLR